MSRLTATTAGAFSSQDEPEVIMRVLSLASVLWLSLPLSLPLVAGAGRAHASPACDAAVQAGTPSRDQLSRCLPEFPHVELAAAVGYRFDLGDGGGGGLSYFARVDAPVFKRLWLDARLRAHTIVQFDLMASFDLSHHYGPGWQSFVSNVQDGPATRTTTIESDATVMRKDWLLAAGMKGVLGKSMDGADRPFDQMAAVGLQYHSDSGFGSHEVIEGYALYGSGGVGATVTWHNSIPVTRGLIFGMEAGYVPADPDGLAYWALADIGYSLEL